MSNHDRNKLGGANYQPATRDPFDVAPRHPDAPPTLEETRPVARVLGDISSDDERCEPPIAWNMKRSSGTATVEGPRHAPISEERANAVTSPGQGVRVNMRGPQLRVNLLSPRWTLRMRARSVGMTLWADLMYATGFGPLDRNLQPEEEYTEMKARTFGVVMLAAALVAVVVGLSAVVYMNHVHTARREAAAALVTEALADSKTLVFGGIDAAAVLDTLDGRTAKEVLDQRKKIHELQTEVENLTKVIDSQKVDIEDNADAAVESSPEPPTPDTAIVRVRRSNREPPTPDTAIVRVRRNK